MTAPPPAGSRPRPSDKLRFLAEVATSEAERLTITDARLFSQTMTTERAASLKADIGLGEQVHAFVARSGRLQDTLADKLLPARLDWLAEPVGPAIDNLTRTERLGWLASTDDWLAVRRLRNRMIHKYVKDPAELAQALESAHMAVPMLMAAAKRLADLD